MDFQTSLEYLYGLGNEVTAMKLGLENIAKLLAALGNPQNNYLKIQVAGTNGKGSTCAFLDAIGISAGIKTGLYTSPHLVSITERIKIGGAEISEDDFARHASRIREAAEKLVEMSELETVPTFFEQVTAIALQAFAEAEIKLAILETGLGGRFDATTAAKAEIAAITPIDYDHQEFLGANLAEIAAEKAAIIQNQTKLVVIAGQNDTAAKIIDKRCGDFGISPPKTNFKAEIVGRSARNFTLNFQTEKARYENVRLNLAGKHQIENAKTALRLAENLPAEFGIKTENIISGLQTAIHRGRLEFYRNILFDGAHNVSGAKALREYLDEFTTPPITVIFGAMRHKDLTEIAALIFPKAATLIFTKPDNPRSLETSELSKFVPEKFTGRVFEIETVAASLAKAREIAAENSLILITGSLYLVGEAQKILKSESVI